MIEQINEHHSPGAYQIETSASFAQEAGWWAVNNIDLLILNLPEDEELQSHFIRRLKNDVPKALPIIFLCNNISSQLMQVAASFAKTRTIKAPVDNYFLYRAVVEILTDYGTKQQIHPRYLVDQPAIVTRQGKDGQLMAQIKNLSMSGAYFEAKDASMKISVDDVIKIMVNVDAGGEYAFDAKVVWVKPNVDAGATGYGVAFLDETEMLNALLKGF